MDEYTTLGCNDRTSQEGLIKSVDPTKLEPPAYGPYAIVQVYTNGTVDVCRNPYIVERLNIRRIILFQRN